MKKAHVFTALTLGLVAAAALPAAAAEVFEGDANVDQRNYPSTAPFIHPPFYNARVAVEVDENGVILSVTDNGTGQYPSVQEGDEELWENKNKPYWDAAAGAGFAMYEGKTLEEVKAMDPYGVDATSGATMAGAAIHEAVINALEGKAGKTFLPGTGCLLPVEEAADGTVVMTSLLPEDFDLEVMDLRWGVTNAEENIVPAEAYEAAYADGKLTIDFADWDALKPGKYYVNVVDAAGVYRSPNFEAGHGEESEAQAGFFVVPCAEDEAVSLTDGQLVLAGADVSDYVANIEHVRIINDATKEEIEQEPVGHHGTVNASFVVFDSEGGFHPEGVVKNRDGSETALFAEGNTYTVEVEAFGYPTFTFAYPETAGGNAAETAAENTAAPAAEEEAAPSLAAWSGTWYSILNYFEEDEVQKALEETAEMAGVTPEELTAQYQEMFANSFEKAEIGEDTVSFYTEAEDRKPAEEAVYRHMGVLDNGMDLFFAEEGSKDLAYLGLWAAEEAETKEGMTHFHLRFGTSVADLMTEDFWYPTVVPEGTTGAQVQNGLMDFAAENYASEEGTDATAEADALLENLSGTYEELFTVICDPAYDELWLADCAAAVGDEAAADAAEMLKSACTGTIYGEEAVKAYGDGSDGAQFDCYFIGGVTNFRFDGHVITGLDEKGKEVFSHEYAFAEPFSIGGMMNGYLYETDAEDAGDFRYFFLLPDTPDTTYHIEFRYGADKEDLAKYNEGSLAYWLAAGIPVERDEALVENVIALFCEENLAAE